MRCTYLGWAGVTISGSGARLLIDPLLDPAAVFAAVGSAADGVEYPAVADPAGDGLATGALVTHLHRDHADAGALRRGLLPGAPVFVPEASLAGGQEDVGIAQAHAELTGAGLTVVEVSAWQRLDVGPFRVTSLPAADGSGDPQLSWAVELDGARVIHCGDTMFHGWWWRMAAAAGPFDAAFLPINGARLNFPWHQPPSPLPAAMTPEQAAVAAHTLGAAAAVPIHYGGFDLDPYYASLPNALEVFEAAAHDRRVTARPLDVGATLDLS
ncbi:MAG: MBL fold metallo-hydrolase [Solirubrobacteraceae bacterium]